jgi:pyrroline-5-carboxylate reductase
MMAHTQPIIAIIGAGNMGHSLIAGLIKHGHAANTIWASDPDTHQLQTLQALGIHTTTDNAQAIAHAAVIIIAVKPQYIRDVLTPLATLLPSPLPLVLTIAAGIRIAAIEDYLGTEVPVVRAMPNTPALISCGATALYANSKVTKEAHALATELMQAVGKAWWVDKEGDLDAVTALSGSGPAYFFLVMEILETIGQSLGLDAKLARDLTLQTAWGAVRMAMESGKTCAELRQQVTSPRGTTEKALSVLEENRIRDIFAAALTAAKLRSEELAHIHRG